MLRKNTAIMLSFSDVKMFYNTNTCSTCNADGIYADRHVNGIVGVSQYDRITLQMKLVTYELQ